MTTVEMIIDEICAECKNYFTVGTFYDTFTITDGEISLSSSIKDGQYFRIVGSLFNDGVYQAHTSDLIDETFDGAVWAMAVPPNVVALAAEIEEYNKSEAAQISPYTSESFGGYSYSRNTDSNGLPIQWKTVFANKLNRYRRIHL